MSSRSPHPTPSYLKIHLSSEMSSMNVCGPIPGLLELLKWTFHYLQPHASWSQRTPTKHGANPCNKMVGWKGFVKRRKEVMVCVSKWENRGSFRGKHADYCIVKWLLIPLACLNPGTQQWLCLPPMAIEPLRSCVLPPSRVWLSIQSVIKDTGGHWIRNWWANPSLLLTAVVHSLLFALHRAVMNTGSPL